MTHFKRHHLPWLVRLILIASLCSPAFAFELRWVGDAGTGWFDDVGGNTNWYDSTNLTDNATLTAGDDLVFLASAIYPAVGDLTLGGATIALNSITVGAPGDTAAGGPSDFGLSYRNLGKEGTIQLGAGGLTAHMAYGATGYGGPGATVRNIRFNTDFELSVDTFFKTTLPTAPYNTLRPYLGGEISGGTEATPIDLVMSTPNGGSGRNMAIYYEQPMPNFVGTLSLTGTNVFEKSGDIWGHSSTVVKLSTPGGTAADPIGTPVNVYLFKNYSGDVVVDNPVVFDPDRRVRLYCYGSTWEFTGDIAGTHTGSLDLWGSANSTFIFSGNEQTFANSPQVWSGLGVVIAGGSGVVWPNAGPIILNNRDNVTGTSTLLLRGNSTLNQLVTIKDQPFSSKPHVPVHIGELNHESNVYHAIFNGRIDVQENDAQVLKLTADADSSATFNGEIAVMGGGFGFDKIGLGTVAINNRVSQGFTNTNPIGTVNVQEGTLLVNSPLADAFYTTGIVVNDEATLGGSGHIVGDVTLDILGGSTAATLAPGASIGTLTVDGDVYFTSAGVLAIEIDGNSVDRLDVTGLLDLSATDDTLLLSLIGPTPNSTLVIASYDSLLGVFDDDNLSLLPSCYRLEYNYEGQKLIALVVPEPASIAMLLCGALALLLWRKRGFKL